MAKRKPKIRHAAIVKRFARRLRELRHLRGMTQAELARQAHMTAPYIGRLEAGGAAPGIDMVERLAGALGTSLHDLLPVSDPPDMSAVLQERAATLFETLLTSADQETLNMLNPLLARLAEFEARKR